MNPRFSISNSLKLLVPALLIIINSCDKDSTSSSLISGCMNQEACNYNTDAIEDDGSCLFDDCFGNCGGDAVVDCTGICGGSFEIDDCGDCYHPVNDSNHWNASCTGCLDPLAVNYNADATIAGNCVYGEKSAKRGIAFDLSNEADFVAISGGVSWWYNWYYETDIPENYYSDYTIDFMPMLWGGSPSENQINGVKTYILNHPEVDYMLVMNEPNLTDQANRTPSQAASDWLVYEQVIEDLANLGRTIYLVGPAMNWGTMTGYSDPIDWLDDFYHAYQNANNGNDPQIDYLAFHWYDYGLSTQLDRLVQYGKQIWITELANWNANITSYEEQIEQMEEMVAICENRDDVFRYAWFYGRGGFPDNNFTYLFGPNPGQLTELGEAYLNLPYTD
jgi:hypothetical protein